MPKLNTTVKAVRVDNDKLAELEKRLCGQTINSWLNEQIDTFLEKKTPNKPSKSDVFSVVPKEVMENIVSMSDFCDGGLAGLMTALNGMLEDGILDTDLSIHRDEWIVKFEDFCREKGMPVEKVADKAIAVLKRGGV